MGVDLESGDMYLSCVTANTTQGNPKGLMKFARTATAVEEVCDGTSTEDGAEVPRLERSVERRGAKIQSCAEYMLHCKYVQQMYIISASSVP